jgi:hypothetical protein
MNTKLILVVLMVALVASFSNAQTDPSCNLFDTANFSAVKPTIAAATVGTSVTIAITMNRQSANNSITPVFHSVDTTAASTTVCQTVDSIDADTWARSTNDCAETYTLTQSLSDIANAGTNSSWVMTLASDGRSIMYTLPIYATYSVNDNEDCYYVSYRYVASFRTVLNVVSNSSEFITSDLSAKFRFSGLRITPENNLEIAGTIIPQLPTFDLRNITMYKVAGNINIPTSTESCAVYPAGCAQTYSIATSSLGGSGAEITGQYSIVINVFEDNVLTRPGVNITYSLTYTIPNNPSIVDTDTISTAVGLYADSSYTALRTTSYTSAVDSLYLENSITATSPAIPSTLKLRMVEGYLCCVSYATSISPYDPNTGTGGCKSAEGKIEWVPLGNETMTPTGVSLVSASSGTPKRYRVQVAMNQVYSTISHSSPMTCEVLLISKLEGPAARRVLGATNLESEFAATVPFSVTATTATLAGTTTMTPTPTATQTQVVTSTSAPVQPTKVVAISSSTRVASVSIAAILISFVLLL